MGEEPKKVIVGLSGASGKGWSNLKDLECYRRYHYISQEPPVTGLIPITPENEMFAQGVFLHAARAKWFELDFAVDSKTLDECCKAGLMDCIAQNYDIKEKQIEYLEYSVQFVNYANYWAIRPKIKPYALEYYLEFDFKVTTPSSDWYVRTTRLDGISYHPDIGGYAIDEFKTTYEMGGTVKYYDKWNPQLLLQKLIYDKCKAAGQDLPDIVGTMMDIWDKGKNKGTRSLVIFDDKILANFEKWIVKQLEKRCIVLSNSQAGFTHAADRNMQVCNTFNDSFKTTCKYKERCSNDQ